MPSLLGVLVSWFPMLLLIGVWVFFMRQMQSGGGKAMGFGKSRARLLTEKHGRVTFNDVAGIDEAKEELQEIVEFLKNPQKFQAVGGRIPKGVLLVGPPGTGKTLLARAIAGEANVPFFTISGSDFVEMFVGVGASRVRDMFEQAKKHAPCIVFIDEIDAVGRHRGAGLGGGNDEREQTLNQLLVEMDGFEANEGVILIAATNRPDVLDPALLRPGRFDRQVVVPNPDVLGREKILNVHIKKVRVGPDVDTKVIARGTPGFSGADLANIVNEAALLAARVGKRMVTMVDFEAAKDKVMMGAERRSMVMTEDEKRLTAYHEAGHAVMAFLSPASDPIHKATIIPRGRALGMVMRLPEGDRLSVSREKLEADIAVAMGGRVAEEQVFGRNKVTAGAASDIEQATKIARHMVTQWGMSDELGPGRLRREPAGDLPRPLGDPVEERLRGDRADDRPRDPPHRRGGPHAGPDGADREPAQSRPDRPGPARARDADRRGDRRHHARRAVGQRSPRRPVELDLYARQARLGAVDLAPQRRRAAGRDRAEPAARGLTLSRRRLRAAADTVRTARTRTRRPARSGRCGWSRRTPGRRSAPAPRGSSRPAHPARTPGPGAAAACR